MEPDLKSDLKSVVKCRVWVEDGEGATIFEISRMNILDAVQTHGSILAASKFMGMSYRAVWGKIKTTEEKLGFSLVVRKNGGARGGGSELTPRGKALVEQFRQLQEKTEEAAFANFQDYFLAAMPKTS